jgi:hypothetical protein
MWHAPPCTPLSTNPIISHLLLFKHLEKRQQHPSTDGQQQQQQQQNFSTNSEQTSSLPSKRRRFLQRELKASILTYNNKILPHLVEQNDAIEVGIEESSVSTACPASWPSMKEYNSLQKHEIYQNTLLDTDPISFTLTIVLAMAKERKHFLKKQIFSSQRRR